MISVSGIRGIVGDGLTPELIVNYAAAVGTFYGRGRVMVGRDSRITGEMVKSAVFSGLMSVGCDPVDLGVCPTPTVQIAVQDSDSVGGIVITASHNPVEWNALKLLGARGLFLDEEEGIRVNRIIDEETFQYSTWRDIGAIGAHDSAIEDHIECVLGIPYLDLTGIRRRKFKVAYDCVNGAGGTILPQLFDRLGCIPYALNIEPHGRFAHAPEPVPKNIGDLCEAVLSHGADIGFAVDPDVDRCAIVSEEGQPLGEEYTVTLATQFILTRKKGDVVVNVSTTRAVEDVAREAGVRLLRTRVGEIHVAKKMAEIGAVIGGEGNGGVLLPDVHLGRDAPVAIVLVLQHLLDSDKPVSRVWRSLPRYAITKKKIDIGGTDPDRILESFRKAHEKDKINLIDGVKVDMTDAWVHIRKSNTEPIIRVMAEARTEEESITICDSTIDEIMNLT